MKPVYTQELVPDIRSLWGLFVSLQRAQGTAETSRKVRASVTILSLALSLGASGTLFSRAEAAEPLRVAALPSVAGMPDVLPSYGSDRPSGAAATYHTVSVGETVWDIAKRHGVAVEDIKAANGMSEDQVIQAGQVLKVPSPQDGVALVPESVPSREKQRIALAEPAPTPESSLSPAESTSATLSDFLDAQRLVKGPSPSDADAELSAVVEDSEFSDRAESTEPMALLPTPSATQPAVRLPAEGQGVPSVDLAPSRNDVPQGSEVGSPTHHQVRPGETVWAIARAHGVAPEALKRANRIPDTNLIFPGDSLVVPGNVSPVDDSKSVKSQSMVLAYAQPATELNQDFAEGLADAAEDAAQVAVPEKVVVAPIEGTDAAVSNADGEVAAMADVATAPEVSEAVSDPYVVGLLANVTEVTQRQSTENVGVTDQGEDGGYIVGLVPESVGKDSTDASSSGVSISSLSKPEVINPQFVPEEADAGAVQNPDADNWASGELLAAAPLGSEVYAPMMEQPEGRVVSPTMPVLPDQENYLPEAPARFNGYIWPAQGVLTSGYGWRWGRMHRGVDIAGPVGTPILAAAAGVVVRSGWNSGGYGNLVDIRHPDGSMTRYAHNSRLLVREGQQVRQGQNIAEMGSTGYSTGPHLHFEIHIPNQGTVNPMAHLSR